MGERTDDFLHAWNGITLNWERVFGAGFGSAPKHWVSVYRESSLDELLRIAKGGLSVPPPEMRLPEMRDEMDLLDRFRPADLVRRGVSRLEAIYAAPTTETPKLPFRKEHIVLELKVDPVDCYVGDMDFITCLIPFIGVRGRSGLEKYRGAFRKYWESVIPFKEFRRSYRCLETADGRQWVLKPGARKPLPRTYFDPEVLVMTHRISQRHIRIVRSASAVDPSVLTRQRSIELWDEST
jgi:hypothetical protein